MRGLLATPLAGRAEPRGTILRSLGELDLGHGETALLGEQSGRAGLVLSLSQPGLGRRGSAGGGASHGALGSGRTCAAPREIG